MSASNGTQRTSMGYTHCVFRASGYGCLTLCFITGDSLHTLLLQQRGAFVVLLLAFSICFPSEAMLLRVFVVEGESILMVMY